MATYKTIFQDDFNDASVGLLTDLGNGSISESGGVLKPLFGVSTNCRWWSNPDYYAPVAYTLLPVGAEGERMFRAEARLTGVGWSGSVNAYVGLVVWLDRANAYWIGYQAENIIGVDRVYNGSAGEYQNLAGVSPNIQPHRYRVYFNLTGSTYHIDEDDASLHRGQIRFYYSLNDGATWFLAQTSLDLPFTPTRVGLMLSNYPTFPATSYDCSWDYLRLDIDDSPRGSAGEREQNAGATDSSAPLDASSTGTVRHTLPQTREGAVVGFDDQWPPEAPGAAKDMAAGSTDIVTTPTAGGTKTRHGLPHTGIGAMEADQRTLDAGSTDGIYFGAFQGQATYDKTTVDRYGHPHFVGNDPKLLVLGDCSNEPWANPTTTGFTGMARDGKSYTDGVEDAGPVYADWYSESESNDRGPRQDFPYRYAIVETESEIVIFDMDDYLGSGEIDVWMRFRYRVATNAWWMIGQTAQRWQALTFWNGGLFGVSQFGGSSVNGALFYINLKSKTVAGLGFAIRKDAAYVTSVDITQRNTASTQWTATGAPSIRLRGTYHNAVATNWASDQATRWVAISNETGVELIRWSTGITYARGDLVETSYACCFDQPFEEGGWPQQPTPGRLWCAFGSKLMATRVEWEQGMIVADSKWHRRRRDLQLAKDYVDLGSTIRHLYALRREVVAATDAGVFVIDQATMHAELLHPMAGIVETNPAAARTRLMATEENLYSLAGSGITADKNGGAIVFKVEDGLKHAFLYPEIPIPRCFAIAALPYFTGGE